MKRIMIAMLFLLCLSPYAELRDPFWPLGFQPSAEETPGIPQNQTPAHAPVRVLSQAEVEKLAREEAERIRNTLERRGTMEIAGNIYAYVQERWVTIGDTITVAVDGQEYRLLITRLTRNDIDLEPHRITPTTNPGTKP